LGFKATPFLDEKHFLKIDSSIVTKKRKDDFMKETSVSSLAELRKLQGKTQVQVAEVLQVTQPQLSKFERRKNHRHSNLQQYMQALGGELELTVIMDGKRYVLPNPK
jgi:predicted XRE-type DNA-binding protein